jgi:hypothetical protein
MSLIHCPECNRQVSERAPSCPHCGCPIGATSHRDRPQQVIIQQPPSSGVGRLFGCLLVLIAAGLLAFSNPTEADMRQKIARDGWAPVGFERTNLVVCNWVSVTGFTGAKAKYLGIAGQIIKLKEE